MRPGLKHAVRPWMIVSAVWVAPALFAVAGVIGGRRLAGEQASVREILWSGGDWLVYALLTPPIFWMSRRWPIGRGVAARRAMLHVSFAVLFCVAWATSGKLLELALALGFDREASEIAKALAGTGSWAAAGTDWLGWVFVTLPFGCVVYFSIAGIAHAIRYFVEARARDVEIARMAEQLSSARFAALQAQVNPHFLFNTLNTIAVLVRDNARASAVEIIEQLSSLLRATLSRHRAPEVSLDEELDLVRTYLAIEQARFSDRLRPSLTIAEGVGGAAVPSFAVQHLVENAIRHGVSRRADAGVIDIAVRRDGPVLIVHVQDDGRGIADSAAQSAGRGLANTRERLSALYGDSASLDLTPASGGGTVATLRLPFRELSREPRRAD